MLHNLNFKIFYLGFVFALSACLEVPEGLNPEIVVVGNGAQWKKTLVADTHLSDNTLESFIAKNDRVVPLAQEVSVSPSLHMKWIAEKSSSQVLLAKPSRDESDLKQTPHIFQTNEAGQMVANPEMENFLFSEAHRPIWVTDSLMYFVDQEKNLQRVEEGLPRKLIAKNVREFFRLGMGYVLYQDDTTSRWLLWDEVTPEELPLNLGIFDQALVTNSERIILIRSSSPKAQAILGVFELGFGKNRKPDIKKLFDWTSEEKVRAREKELLGIQVHDDAISFVSESSRSQSIWSIQGDQWGSVSLNEPIRRFSSDDGKTLVVSDSARLKVCSFSKEFSCESFSTGSYEVEDALLASGQLVLSAKLNSQNLLVIFRKNFFGTFHLDRQLDLAGKADLRFFFSDLGEKTKTDTPPESRPKAEEQKPQD